MSVSLSDSDRQMLDGRRGEGAKMAMSILVRMAEVYEAEELMDVSQAHIDGCGLMSEAGLEFAEALASKGARVAVPTTLNMGPLDLQNWREFGIPEEFAAGAIRQAAAYERMGCVPTWTCAPYQGYLTPRFGQQIAWGESNAILYANSVLGARTNRYGDYIDICAAITGRVPKCGLHLDENRKGQILLRLVDVEEEYWNEDGSHAALGHLIGPLAEDKVAVLDGMPPHVSDDQLKALCAAAASSGAVALLHIVGVTPEAKTLEEAFRGNTPRRVVELTRADLAAALADLSTASEGDPLDLVVLGCPHFSFSEFSQLAELLNGQSAEAFDPRVEFVVISGRASFSLVQRSEIMQVLNAWGVRVTLDTCPFHTPMVGPNVKVLMTNSGKCAYYAPGELGVRVAFGSMADCVRSAIEGRVCRKEL